MDAICPVCNSKINAADPVCPSCGFRLIESTQSFRPVAVSEGEISPALDEQPTMAVLRVVRGPQVEMTFYLKEGPYTVGRSPQCDIFLNDMTVSRKHALIFPTGTGFSIKDTNSFNGVWISNISVNETVLRDGDIIQIGAFCLLYQGSPAQ